MQPFAVADAGLDRVAERVAEVEQRAFARLALVGRDDLRLDPAALADRVGERLGVAREQRSMFASSQSKNARSRMAPYLMTSARPRGKLAVRQRAQTVGVDQHGARLMERADHVLAERVVDAGLAADRRVDLREQRRRHLHERHSALIDRRGEAGDVADDAAAERDQRRRALGLLLEQARQHVGERRPSLVRLAVGDEDRVGGDVLRGEARSQRTPKSARRPDW